MCDLQWDNDGSKALGLAIRYRIEKVDTGSRVELGGGGWTTIWYLKVWRVKGGRPERWDGVWSPMAVRL